MQRLNVENLPLVEIYHKTIDKEMLKRTRIILLLIALIFVAYLLLIDELLEVSYGFANFPFRRLTPEVAAQKALWNALIWTVPIAVLLNGMTWFFAKHLLNSVVARKLLLFTLCLYIFSSTYFIYSAHQKFLQEEKVKSTTSLHHLFNQLNTST